MNATAFRELRRGFVALAAIAGIFAAGCVSGKCDCHAHRAKVALIAEACQINGIVAVRRTVTDAIAQAGFVPLVLPDLHDPATEDEILDRADALVIFGSLGAHGGRRPIFEKRLIRAAAAKRIPVVGLCHGHQVINEAFGGTTVRAPTNAPVKVVHTDRTVSPYIRDCFHTVTVREGSMMARALGAGVQTVNTSHAGVVGKVGDGFEVTARAADGVVEAIEHRTLPVVGFEFHPERLSPKDPRFCNLIRYALENEKGRSR